MENWDTRAGKLLFVGSDSIGWGAVSRRLAEAGYLVVTATTGREGVDSAVTNQPDVVFLDVGVGDVGAEATIAALRASKLTSHIPVVAMAASGRLPEVESCLAAGAEDHQFAPFSYTVTKTQAEDYTGVSRRRRSEDARLEREGLLKIERDVLIARQIQAGFLPKELPQPSGWEVAARFYPAREVAGDFYDAFTLTQGRRIGLVIADVCDKGVGAALFMVLFRSLLRAFSQQHYSMRWTDILNDKVTPGITARQRATPITGSSALKNAMDLTNDYISRTHGDSNMFATTFFAVLDPTNGQLMYVNGGHNPPVIVGTKADGTFGIKARLKPTGPALGMLPNIEYRIGQVALEPGDTLFAFTDGVTDVKDAAGKLLGEPSMLRLVVEPAATADGLLARVDEAVHAHMGSAPQFDDVTMIALHRGPAAATQ